MPKLKTKERLRQRELKTHPIDAAKLPHSGGYISSDEPRLKKSVFIIRVVDKQGNIRWIRKENKFNKKPVMRYSGNYNPSRKPKEIRKEYNKETFKKETIKETEYQFQEEDIAKVKKSLNHGYIKKKHYGRFTRNPHQTGREIEIIPTNLTIKE